MITGDIYVLHLQWISLYTLNIGWSISSRSLGSSIFIIIVVPSGNTGNGIWSPVNGGFNGKIIKFTVNDAFFIATFAYRMVYQKGSVIYFDSMGSFGMHLWTSQRVILVLSFFVIETKTNTCIRFGWFKRMGQTRSKFIHVPEKRGDLHPSKAIVWSEKTLGYQVLIPNQGGFWFWKFSRSVLHGYFNPWVSWY